MSKKSRIYPCNIQELRYELGLSLREFSELIGVSITTVCLWESKKGGITARSSKKLTDFASKSNFKINFEHKEVL